MIKNDVSVPEKIEKLRRVFGSYEEVARHLDVSLQSIFEWKKGRNPHKRFRGDIDKLYLRYYERE